MDVRAPLISYGETPEAVEPCEGAFDYPSMPTELVLALDSLARNTREDAALAASFAATRVIASLVGMALVGPSLRAARLSANRRNGVGNIGKHRAVMDVGTCQPGGKWNTAPVCHEMPFRPRLPRSIGFGPVVDPPFLRESMMNPR